MTRLALLTLLCCAPACTTMLTPVYTPKSELTIGGTATLGNVHYLPHEQDGFDANELDDSAVGRIVLSEPVADFVRRALASELKTSGVALDANAPLAVVSDVEAFKVGTAGFRVEWYVRLRIGVMRRSDHAVLYEGTFDAELTHGKFATWELSGFPAAVVAQALQKFFQQEEALRLLRG